MGVETDKQFASIERVGSLPLVTSAFSAYDSVKTKNPVFQRSLSMAEAAIRMAWGGASPIVNQFEGPLSYVDKMACQGLDYVETNMPAIKQPPTELYNSTKTYLGDQVQKGVAYGFGTLDAGLNVADSAVDKILPPNEEEVQTDGFAEAAEAKSGREVVNHAVGIGEKVRVRLTRASLGRLTELKDGSRAALLRLSHALEVLANQAKDGVRRGSDAFRTTEKIPPSVLALAQALLDSLTKTADMAQNYLPAGYQSQFETMKEYATNIYCQLSLSTSDAAANGVKKAREQLSNIQDLLNNSVSNVAGATGLSRFLPAPPADGNGSPNANAVPPNAPNGTSNRDQQHSEQLRQ